MLLIKIIIVLQSIVIQVWIYLKVLLRTFTLRSFFIYQPTEEK